MLLKLPVTLPVIKVIHRSTNVCAQMLSNLILGVVVLLSSIFFYLQTTDLPERSALFPQFILWGLVIVGILLIFQALLEGRKKVSQEVSEARREERGQFNDILIFQVAVPGGLLLVAYGLLVSVGFYPASTFLVFTIYSYHAYRIDAANLKSALWMRAIFFALVITLFMYLIFTLLLGLPAPSGALF
ncbi:tripartite tricarboxylate transporter TctB family protein [Halomonas sp. SpR1]|uniref:tripartite tricarboxylate transporter TctB family protein n=1 Tax=Halomonas sp. SpR1 TaxID=3050462 RepID=UPI0027E48F47|nr:tripartite tricarboxylate transporter TctB family protein [Halomonas sp. SpR1]MDQ7732474.1 tripartite tricarboxylate transporter TctB family protein [Halomonas sp. SpR1]